MSDLRIVFMGTPEFAVTSLDILVKNNFNVVGVVTSPDRPAGRGLEIHQSAIKKYCIEHKLKVLQPEKLKDEKFVSELKSLNADLQIVVAFRMLPEIVWNMPKLGTFNLHASLLPHYRGAAPINWAIINGEKETGVTTFFLQQEIDTGKVIFQEKVSIAENETAGELHDKLMHVGAELVLKTVKAIEKGNYPQTEQSDLAKGEAIKEAPKIFKEDCKIKWNDSAEKIHNFIRGLSPYPTAYTLFRNKKEELIQVKIYRSEKEELPHALPYGKVISDNGKSLKIAVNGGFIRILELQQAGKKRMYADEFLRGFSFADTFLITK